MIDRIKFEIKGVSLEHFITIEDKLGFDDAGLHGKERVAIKSTTYRNIRFKYFAVYKLLTIEGSLHKFCKGNNYGDFTYAEMKTVLIELSEMVDIHLSRFHVTKMEIGVNARMKEAPTEYLDMLHSYKSRPFIDMTPLAKKAPYVARDANSWNMRLNSMTKHSMRFTGTSTGKRPYRKISFVMN